MKWAIAAIVGYLLLTTRGTGTPARRAPAPTSAAATTTPTGTQITLPGVGSYMNIPGVVSSITIDPRFLGLNPAAPQPDPTAYPGLAAPQLSTDYIPEAQLDPPLRLVPATRFQLDE